MKTTIIAVILLAVLAGGGYYYWEIYRVPSSAMDLVLAFQDFGKAMQKMESSRPKDSDDYSPIVEGIGVLESDLKNVSEKLSSLWPPSKLGEVHGAMIDVVAALEELTARAKIQARFMADLSDVIRTLIPKEFNKTLGPDATVSDIANLWTDAVPKMKSKGDVLFAGESVAIKGTTFEELKSNWAGARDHFDVVLVLVRAQNQKMPAQDFNLDSVKMTDREKASFEKVGTFFDLVEKTVRENSAYDIMSGNFTGKAAYEAFQAKNAKLEAAFKKFSDENPEIVKRLEAEAQKRGLKP